MDRSERLHRCPPNCHNCPHLDGDVMPNCMGTAALSLESTSLAWCTCAANQELPAEDSTAARIAALEARIAELEARL
ncbi:hypothetical protein ABT160_02525 [Streptomyces sp. NPDC001941]|uniref:hypothetical protein n=1 Tax=Streptomyces sp. NPDC001941 TaxID=3154659 RepID=UPI0033331AB7